MPSPARTGPENVSPPKPVLLLILDGWGHSEKTEGNAIAQARCPNWRRLLAESPHSLIHTSGLAVGLPEGQMGNSEVGHMNLGAGRIVYQDLTRIDQAIAEGSFYRNPALTGAVDAANAVAGTLHLMGLLSPGGVHSHEDHIHAMVQLAHERDAASIAVHAFLDGRDTPPQSARPSLERLQQLCAGIPGARIATVGGRYYAMDRDHRWERTERAWHAIVDARADHRAGDAVAALEDAYARGENDEFVAPTLIDGGVPVRDGDAVVFMNFRADRARQLSAAFVAPDFDGFAAGRRPQLARFVCLTEYSTELPAEVAFAPDTLTNTLPKVIAERGLTQLRIAETEKYAHVTFFFNGGHETPYPGEQRVLVPSPKVATYDLQPQMSCPEVTDRLVEAIAGRQFDLIVCNLANADMVGHSGKLDAGIAAVEAVDAALGRIVAALRQAGGEMLLTADHGNIEQMRDPDSGQPHTAHTTGPVPLVYLGRPARLREGGALRDVAPSVLQLLELPVPPEMTGRSLILPA
ncbi:MAG TPA: 2,3-bisphosphoglycerate-independent phosphoglycerate mutase [Xanthomonadaceae bacterium]|nr:2,3-bisphosphoglycerate-independent phosphoglycerate mutase [Xanthomonadaceae bacterium]